MKISVVVPVYNEEKVVCKVINLIHRTFLKNKKVDRFEIVAVDDGSTDKSFDQLRKIKKANFRFLSHKRNKGYGAALKTGIRNSKYDWVMIIDADGT